jgi:hypothetical protein
MNTLLSFSFLPFSYFSSHICSSTSTPTPLLQVSKFKSAASATVLKPAGTFTRVSIVRAVSHSSSQLDADNSDGDGEDAGGGTGPGGAGDGEENGGYSTSLGSGKEDP